MCSARIAMGVGTMGLTEGFGIRPLAEAGMKSMTPKMPEARKSPFEVTPETPVPLAKPLGTKVGTGYTSGYNGLQV